MTTDSEKVAQILCEAVEIDSAEERRRFLDEACAGDEQLRARVEQLIGNHFAAGSFMERPAVEDAATALLAGTSDGVDEDASGSHTMPGTDEIPLDFLDPPTREGTLGHLGHYEILDCLGQGAFGIVFRAFDDTLQRVVAVKVLAPALTSTSPPRKRFLREALAAAKVRHENVVQIYAVEEQPLPFLVMEYIPGETLQDRLDRTGPLEVPDVLRLGHQIARGLAAAHGQGLIHRDVKPGNILLETGPEERVKITDFGLARAADDASLTQSGFVAGTPMFMAPEQARGESIDQRADLFSLGSVLYTMVSGRPPFRASNTVAVLKRVCDDTPRPIPELIPETPAWLIDIIEKLHAKQPEERIQSATEVASLLGSHLAQLQHSGVVPLTSNVAPPRRRQSQFRRRTQWLAAAGVLLAVLGGLGLSDAAGVTHVGAFIATVLRIQTPDGTLVVQVDDPQVQITIEGDGGIRITGAGPQEVRLQPGRYHVEASKDGKPFKDELVTIERGGQRIVRVTLESPAAQVGHVAGPVVEQPFVVLGGGGVAERNFDTLSEAVAGASDGDAIEIHGNGPFVSEPIRITHPLTIRAGSGFWPVISFSVPVTADRVTLIDADAPLVLEGLELRQLDPNLTPNSSVLTATSSLYAANCRFLNWQSSYSYQIEAGFTELRNSEFLSPRPYKNIFPWSDRQLVMDNCCLLNCSLLQANGQPEGRQFRLTHNMWQSSHVICIGTDTFHNTGSAQPDWTTRALRMEVLDNVFDVSHVVVFQRTTELAPGETELSPARNVGWHAQRNTYGTEGFLALKNLTSTGYQETPAELPPGLAGWTQLWGTAEEGSLEGRVRFQGGDLNARAETALETITPDDFRLRPDSAGYHAGPGGKDLGADVDLVGPGAAYERWMQTPDYQEWLNATQLLMHSASN